MPIPNGCGTAPSKPRARTDNNLAGAGPIAVLVGGVGGYYHNVVKPDGTADGMVRVIVNVIIPQQCK